MPKFISRHSKQIWSPKRCEWGEQIYSRKRCEFGPKKKVPSEVQWLSKSYFLWKLFILTYILYYKWTALHWDSFKTIISKSGPVILMELYIILVHSIYEINFLSRLDLGHYGGTYSLKFQYFVVLIFLLKIIALETKQHIGNKTWNLNSYVL